MAGLIEVSCSLGLLLNEECHKKSYCRNTGTKNIHDLTIEDKALIEQRIGMKLSIIDSTICYHHEKVYLSRYESLQKVCADPFKTHTQQIKSKLSNYYLINTYIYIIVFEFVESLRVVNFEDACKMNIKPGQKICPNCETKLKNEKLCENDSEISTESEEEEVDKEILQEDAKSSLLNIGCSPVRQVSAEKKIKICKKKSIGITKCCKRESSQSFKYFF